MPVSKNSTPRALWDKIRAKRREYWKAGTRVRVETIIKQLPIIASDPEVLAELAFQEYCLREEHGEEPDPTEFLRRFPKCVEQLRQLFIKHFGGKEGSGVTDTVEFPSADSTLAGARQSHHEVDRRESSLESLDEDERGKRIGRYTVIDKIGYGAMGIVYLARDVRLDRPVALKLPRFTDDAVNDGIRTRFYREARAAAAIEHPNICPVYDIGEVDGQDFIAMAYIAGPTLDAMMKEAGPLDVVESCRLLRDIARALDECHLHGVIHRDIKPSNIIVNQRGTPIIMDFGLAAMENASRVTLDQQVVGTLRYMSPEQILGQAEDIGPRSDVYSLGATLYELITNHPPFEGDHYVDIANKIERDPPAPPSEWRAGIDPELDEICVRVLQKNPEDRFPSMAALADALDSYCRCRGG